MQSKRSLKVAEFLREEVAKIIRYEIKDPGVTFVTVIKVDLSPDMKYAKVFVNVLGDAEVRESTMAALERAKSFVRHQISQIKILRFVPEFRFIYDDTLDYVEKIERLINEAKK